MRSAFSQLFISGGNQPQSILIHKESKVMCIYILHNKCNIIFNKVNECKTKKV